mmetsp:Transcript_43561/g.120453  ORF Transcript_43561/g.120453 Transcript_43561/m.120453 type:complete len:248 (+) Transcript_43561:2023-2766(+)
MHPHLHRCLAEGDGRARLPRHALAHRHRRPLRHAVRHRPPRGRDRVRRSDGHLRVQHGRRVGQCQKVHRQGRPRRAHRRARARVRQGWRGQHQKVADLQGRRHRRHGGRPAQGHVGPGAQHPHEAHGDPLRRLRAALPRDQQRRRPHRQLLLWHHDRGHDQPDRRAGRHHVHRGAAGPERLRRPHLCRRRHRRHGRLFLRVARDGAAPDAQVAQGAAPRLPSRGHRQHAPRVVVPPHRRVERQPLPR